MLRGFEIDYDERYLVDNSNNSDSNVLGYSYIDGSPSGPQSTISDGDANGRGENISSIIFWALNVLILIIILGLVLFRCTKYGVQFVENWTEARANGHLSDSQYAANIIRQRNLEAEEKKESPESRKIRLIENFNANNVLMVVKEADFISALHSMTENDDFDSHSADECSGDIIDSVDVDSLCDDDQLGLRLPSGLTNADRTVPNCCAVCLCHYDIGDKLVWSCNENCQHAFHDECIIEWLVKMQDGTPCPCCRQEFTNLVPETDLKKKLHDPQRAFNLSIISLRGSR